LGVGPTKGYELIKEGRLKTRMIDNKRIGTITDGREFLDSLPNSLPTE
jgi:hypothetical protein